MLASCLDDRAISPTAVLTAPAPRDRRATVLVLNSLASRTGALAEEVRLRLGPSVDVELIDVEALLALTPSDALDADREIVFIVKDAAASTVARRDVRHALEAQGTAFLDVHVESHLDAYIEREASDSWRWITSALARLTGSRAVETVEPEYDFSLRADWNTLAHAADVIVAALVRRGLIDGDAQLRSA